MDGRRRRHDRRLRDRSRRSGMTPQALARTTARTTSAWRRLAACIAFSMTASSTNPEFADSRAIEQPHPTLIRPRCLNGQDFDFGLGHGRTPSTICRSLRACNKVPQPNDPGTENFGVHRGERLRVHPAAAGDSTRRPRLQTVVRRRAGRFGRSTNVHCDFKSRILACVKIEITAWPDGHGSELKELPRPAGIRRRQY